MIRLIGAAAIAATLTVAAIKSPGLPASSTLSVLQQGWGVNRMHFMGHWQQVRGVHDGRFKGASVRSFHAGDGMTAEVRAKAMRFYGVRGPTGGKALLLIDNARRVVIDFYAPRKQTRALLFATPALGEGLHVADLIVLGTHDRRSRGSYVNLDSIELLQ